MIPIQDDITEMFKTLVSNINSLNLAIMKSGGSSHVLPGMLDKPLSEFMDTLARDRIYLNAQYKEPEDVNT